MEYLDNHFILLSGVGTVLLVLVIPAWAADALGRWRERRAHPKSRAFMRDFRL